MFHMMSVNSLRLIFACPTGFTRNYYAVMEFGVDQLYIDELYYGIE